MKSILVFLISTLISIAAFADVNPVPPRDIMPSCPVLRTGKMHVRLYKQLAASQNQDGSWTIGTEKVCDLTTDINIYDISNGFGNCTMGGDSGHVSCSVTQQNGSARKLFINGLALVNKDTDGQLFKELSVSMVEGTPYNNGKIRSAGMDTTDIGLKDATLHIFFDKNDNFDPTVKPDDVSLAVTFEDPNAR